MSEHQLWNELGNIHMSAGEYDQAIGAYKKAVELAPQSGDAYITLANAYIEIAEPAKSTQYYQRGIELFEDFTKKAEAWYQLGAAYQDLHDYQNSLLAFERAVALDPENMLYQEELENILLTISEGMLEEVEEKQTAPQFQAEQGDVNSISPKRPTWKDEARPKVIDTNQSEIEAKTQSGEFFSDWFKSAISSFDRNSTQKSNEQKDPPSVVKDPEQVQIQSEATDDFVSTLEEENPELDDNVLQLINSLSQEINTEISITPHNEEQAKWLIDYDEDEYEDDTQESSAEEQMVESEVEQARLLLDDEYDLQKDMQDLMDDSSLKVEGPVVEEPVVGLIEEYPQATDVAAQLPLEETKTQVEEHLAEQEDIKEYFEMLSTDEVEGNVSEAEALAEYPAHEIDEQVEEPEEIVVKPSVALSTDEAKKNIPETEVAIELAVKVAETQAGEPISEQEAEEEPATVLSADEGKEETAVIAELPVQETQAELEVLIAKQEVFEEPATILSTDEAEEHLQETEVVAELPVEEAQAQLEDLIVEKEVIEESAALLSIDEAKEHLQETEVVAELPAEETQTQVEEPIAKQEIIEEAVAAATETPLSVKEILANANVWKQIGSVFFEAEIFDGAVVAFQKAIEINNTDGISLHNLAVLYAKRGEYEKAVGLYKESIAHLNSDEEKIASLNNLGNTYRAMRNYEAAQEAYRQADELDLQKLVLKKWTSNEILGLQIA